MDAADLMWGRTERELLMLATDPRLPQPSTGRRCRAWLKRDPPEAEIRRATQKLQHKLGETQTPRPGYR